AGTVGSMIGTMVLAVFILAAIGALVLAVMTPFVVAFDKLGPLKKVIPVQSVGSAVGLDLPSDEEIEEYARTVRDDPQLRCLADSPPVVIPAASAGEVPEPLVPPGTQVSDPAVMADLTADVIAEVPRGTDAEVAQDFFIVALAGGTDGWAHYARQRQRGATATDFFRPGTDLEPYEK